MTSSRVAHELASILVPIGIVGAAVAVLCAALAAVAIARGNAGLAGGAVGVWVPAAVLSLAASFASQWVPLIVSGAALVGMLVVGAVARSIISAGAPAREAARAARADETLSAQDVVPAPRTTTASVATASTGSLPALAS